MTPKAQRHRRAQSDQVAGGKRQTKILQRMDMNKKNEKQTLQASQLSTWGCKGSMR